MYRLSMPTGIKLINTAFFFLIPFISPSQTVIGNWTFNNTLAATSGPDNTVSNASLSSSIPTGQYNGGTVYFGEGGWPTGTTVNSNMYLEFTLSPNAGHQLHVSSIDFNIRRSTTGSPSGAGPRRWALRSSLDGYSSNILDNALSTSPSVISVSLGGSYVNLSTPITFRVYGYDVYNNPGGLNRFVFENITVRGLSALPIDISVLKVVTSGQQANLSWSVGNAAEVKSVAVQRSLDGSTFTNIAELPANISGSYQYNDRLIVSAASKLYYRILVTEQTGTVVYSGIEAVSVSSSEQQQIHSISTNRNTIQATVTATQSGTGFLLIYSTDGKRILQQSIQLKKGVQIVQVQSPSQAGIMILSVLQNGTLTSRKFYN